MVYPLWKGVKMCCVDLPNHRDQDLSLYAHELRYFINQGMLERTWDDPTHNLSKFKALILLRTKKIMRWNIILSTPSALPLWYMYSKSSVSLSLCSLVLKDYKKSNHYSSPEWLKLKILLHFSGTTILRWKTRFVRAAWSGKRYTSQTTCWRPRW